MDVKTTSPRRINTRVGVVSKQGDNAFLDLRGQSFDHAEVEREFRRSIRNYGAKMDSITILTDDEVLYWEKEG